MKPTSISNLIKKFTCLSKNSIINNLIPKLLPLLVAFCINISCNPPRHAAGKIDVTGNWQITIAVAEGTIMGKGSLSQEGDVVSGWIGPSENDPISVKGAFKNGNLLIKTLPRPGRTVAFDQVELTVAVDTMSGSIENGSHGKGTIRFTRLKSKS